MKKCTRCNKPNEIRKGRTVCKPCEYIEHVEYARRPDKLPIIMLQSAKHRAKRDGVPCTITAKDIVIPKVCPALGVKLEQGTRQNHANAPTLDRVFPERGYIPGNVRVISHKANLIKNNATLDELECMVEYIRDSIAYAVLP
jgi:hypothetical protein